MVLWWSVYKHTQASSSILPQPTLPISYVLADWLIVFQSLNCSNVWSRTTQQAASLCSFTIKGRLGRERAFQGTAFQKTKHLFHVQNGSCFTTSKNIFKKHTNKKYKFWIQVILHWNCSKFTFSHIVCQNVGDTVVYCKFNW